MDKSGGAPCPALWEFGPFTLPKLTASLYGICHKLKDYLKRREPNALQFGCLKTSISAGFQLVSTEAGVAPRVGTGRTLPLGAAGTPRDSSVFGGRRQAGQAIGDHPANLWPGFFRQVPCYTCRKAYTGCTTMLKTEYGTMTYST